MSGRQDLGRQGEKLADRHLRRNGYRIVERNYRCPAGEVDLIALGPDELCFVEVKTRRSDSFAPPQVNVNVAKRRRIRRIADHYLAGHRLDDIHVRFDVIAIVLCEDGEHSLEHYEGAF